MPFGDHLEELRRRLIYALIGVVVCAVGALFFGRELIVLLLSPLLRGMSNADLPMSLLQTDLPMAFTIFIKISLIAGLVIAAPWVAYQIWAFIAAGLYAHERRVAFILMPFSTVMMVLGVLFAYFIMLPIIVAFFIAFSLGYEMPTAHAPSLFDIAIGQSSAHDNASTDEAPSDAPNAPAVTVPILDADPSDPAPGQIWVKYPEREIRIYLGGAIHHADLMRHRRLFDFRPTPAEFISFALWITLGIVAAFQLPPIMLVVGWTRVLDPAWLAKYRRHCALACAVAGAFLTPADPLSMVILAVPLYLLFEFGLLLMQLVYHPRTAE